MFWALFHLEDMVLEHFDTLTFLRGMNEQTLGDVPLGLSSPYCALGFEMLFQNVEK